MFIHSLFLIVLLGGPSQPAPEAVAPEAPLVAGNSLYNLFLSPTWQEDLEERMGGRAEHGRVSESADQPIPPALLAGPAFPGQASRGFGVQDIPLDLLLGWAFWDGADNEMTLFGMEAAVLADLSRGSFGLALSFRF